MFQSGKNTTLLRQLEEQTLQMKDMNQELVDVKQTLAHTQKGMSVYTDTCPYPERYVSLYRHLPIPRKVCQSIQTLAHTQKGMSVYTDTCPYPERYVSLYRHLPIHRKVY